MIKELEGAFNKYKQLKENEDKLKQEVAQYEKELDKSSKKKEEAKEEYQTKFNGLYSQKENEMLEALNKGKFDDFFKKQDELKEIYLFSPENMGYTSQLLDWVNYDAGAFGHIKDVVQKLKLKPKEKGIMITKIANKIIDLYEIAKDKRLHCCTDITDDIILQTKKDLNAYKKKH